MKKLFATLILTFLISCSSKKATVKSILPETSEKVLERAASIDLKPEEKIPSKELEDFLIKRSSVAYRFSISKNNHVYFTHTENNIIKEEDKAPLEYFDYGPMIISNVDNSWKVFDLREKLISFYWAGVYADSKFEHIWGILDLGISSQSQNFLVINSEDKGITWSLVGSIPKPREDVVLEEFKYYSSGKIEVLLTQRFDESGISRGREIYRGVSIDAGRSWVIGDSERDMTVEAASPSASREGSCENIYPWPGELLPTSCLIPLKKLK